jgi:hypothetical protein
MIKKSKKLMERIEKQIITPGQAEAMLKLNINNNRPVSNVVVNQYAIDMMTGKWVATGDSIKFDKQGRLNDGQHRLHAIIRAGIPVEMWVCYDLEETAIKYIDTGRKRSAKDLFFMNNVGGGYANEIIALTRKIISWEENQRAVLSRMNRGGTKLKTSISNHAIMEYVETHKDIIEHAQYGKLLFQRTPVKLFSATDLGFLRYLFVKKDPIAAEEFLEKLCMKDNVAATSPIACLYNRILGSRDSLTPFLKLQLTFVAWNLWREGKQVNVLKVGKLDGVPELV